MNQVWYSLKRDVLILMPFTIWQAWSEFEIAKKSGKDTGMISSVQKEGDESGRVIMSNGDTIEFIGDLGE